MTGRTSLARVLGLLLAAVVAFVAASLWRERPARVLADLGAAVEELERRAGGYRASGDHLTADKLDLVVGLLRGESDPAGMPTTAEAADADPRYRDDLRSEALVVEEVATLGEPTLSQLAVTVAESADHPGRAALGLRVLVGVAPERGREAVASLVRDGRNDVVTWEAVVLVARLSMRELEPDLMGLVGRWKGWGRQYPVDSLRRLGCRAAVPVIVPALVDASPAVRRHAARALGELGDPVCLGHLRTMLAREGDPVARFVAEAALARLEAGLRPLERVPGAQTGAP